MILPLKNLCLSLAAMAVFLEAAQAAKDSSDFAILAVPDFGKTTFLTNASGKPIHVWHSQRPNGGGARLLPNGNLLRVTSNPLESTFRGVGFVGGGLEILNKDGGVVWSFWNAVTREMSYGDTLMLPNGNVLSLILEWKNKDEAHQLGRDPEFLSDQGLVAPGIIEYSIRGNNAGIPVWKWSSWDHLYQTRHPSLDNFASAGPPQGCIDINSGPARSSKRWLTASEIDYHEPLDMILVIVADLGEAWLIDHSTASHEARTDKGGKSGKGGRILQRLTYPVPPGAPRKFLTSGRFREVLNREAPELELLGSDGILFTARRSSTASAYALTPATTKPCLVKGPRNALEMVRNVATTPHGIVAATGFGGLVAFLNAESMETKWFHQNIHGEREFTINSKPGEGGCCGGAEDQPSTVPASADPAPQAKAALKYLKAAPLSRIRLYPSSYQR